ncbi:MAG: hypothetical protein V4443_06415 [Pseudomonadota bacterium]
MKTVLIVFALILCLGGCVSNLGAPPKIDSTYISAVDNRTQEQKESYRDSVLSPIAVLGDENLEPPAILFLQNALQRHQKQRSMLNIEITEFYVIDFFPARLHAATTTGGWLTDAIVRDSIRSNTDWAFVNAIGVPTDGNSIVILFSGKLNNKPIKVSTFSQYYASGFGAIRNDTAFIEAVKSSIDKAAVEIISKLDD